MPSIYDHVFPTLPREVRPRDLKVEAAKIPYAGWDPVDLATAYANADREKDRLKELVSAVQVTLDALEDLLIVTHEAAEEHHSRLAWGSYGAAPNALRLATGDKLEVRKEISVKITDPAALNDWAKETDDSLRTVNAQRVAALTREMLARGEEEPPGTFPATWKKIVFTAAKT